jgi:hypothetical protein
MALFSTLSPTASMRSMRPAPDEEEEEEEELSGETERVEGEEVERLLDTGEEPAVAEEEALPSASFAAS